MINEIRLAVHSLNLACSDLLLLLLGAVISNQALGKGIAEAAESPGQSDIRPDHGFQIITAAGNEYCQHNHVADDKKWKVQPPRLGVDNFVMIHPFKKMVGAEKKQAKQHSADGNKCTQGLCQAFDRSAPFGIGDGENYRKSQTAQGDAAEKHGIDQQRLPGRSPLGVPENVLFVLGWGWGFTSYIII